MTNDSVLRDIWYSGFPESAREEYSSVGAMVVFCYLTPTWGFYYRCNYILGCDGKPKPFSVEDQEKIVKNVIEPMAGDGLRTICVAYKDYHTDPGENNLVDHC